MTDPLGARRLPAPARRRAAARRAWCSRSLGGACGLAPGDLGRRGAALAASRARSRGSRRSASTSGCSASRSRSRSLHRPALRPRAGVAARRARPQGRTHRGQPRCRRRQRASTGPARRWCWPRSRWPSCCWPARRCCSGASTGCSGWIPDSPPIGCSPRGSRCRALKYADAARQRRSATQLLAQVAAPARRALGRARVRRAAGRLAALLELRDRRRREPPPRRLGAGRRRSSPTTPGTSRPSRIPLVEGRFYDATDRADGEPGGGRQPGDGAPLLEPAEARSAPGSRWTIPPIRTLRLADGGGRRGRRPPRAAERGRVPPALPPVRAGRRAARMVLARPAEGEPPALVPALRARARRARPRPRRWPTWRRWRSGRRPRSRGRG